MSKEALAWLRETPEAKMVRSPTQWAVLKEVVWKYDEKRGYAWPGVSWLAQETRLARSTVQIALGELERVGWLYRVQRSGSSNCYLVPRYRDNVADFRGARQPGTPQPVAPLEGARQPGTPQPPTGVGGARQPDMGAREPGGDAREPGRGVPESRAQQVVDTHETDSKQVKPDGDSGRSVSQGMATGGQLAYLVDIYILTTGALPVVEQRQRDAAMTAAEADDAIKAGWRGIEQSGVAYVPTTLRVHLSPRGQQEYEKRSRDAA